VATNSWQISESAISVALRPDGGGELAFTVTNTGQSTDRAVLTVTPQDGAADSWFTVDEPQRQVGPGVSVIYEVAVAAPPGTPAGTYAVTGVVYSADGDPSESSASSKRIALVLASARPAPSAPRWPYLVAVVAVLLVVGVVAAIVLTRGDDAEADLPDLQVVTTPSCSLTPLFAGDYLFGVDAGVRFTGPQGPDVNAPVELRNERTGGATTVDLPIAPSSGAAASSTLTLGVPATDTGLTERYTLTVDPGDAIPESDEDNNTVTVEVTLSGAGTIPCSRV
jgi:hypothetical protein